MFKPKSTAEPASRRDEKRRQDLQRLRPALSGLFKLKGRYPTPSEFEQIRQDLDPPAIDPKEGQSAGFNDKKFGYYYSQIPEGLGTPKPDYYRLWCFLEKTKSKFEISSEDPPPGPVSQSPSPEVREKARHEDKNAASAPVQPLANNFLLYLSLVLILFNLGLTLALILSLKELLQLQTLLQNLVR